MGIILDFLFFVVSSEQFAALLFFLFALLMFHKLQIRPVHHELWFPSPYSDLKLY